MSSELAFVRLTKHDLMKLLSKKTENKMNQLQAQEEELKRKMEFRNRKQKE